MEKLSNLDEFSYDGKLVSTDLGSAWFEQYYDELGDAAIFIEGKMEGDDVTLILRPEDTPEFNVNISASDEEITQSMLDFKAELRYIDIIESNTIVVEDEKLDLN